MSVLNRKLLVLATLIALFAVGMTTLLIAFKVDNTYHALRHSRYDLVARDVDKVIEKSFTLGLSFNELTALPTALARRKLADAAIVAINVAGRNEIIIYSTEPTHLGQSIPETWRAAVRQQQALTAGAKNADYRWQYWGDAESVAGTIVTNSFGVQEGFIAVQYGTKAGTATGASVRSELFSALLPTVLTTLVVTAILLFVLLAILMRRFERDTTHAASVFKQMLNTDETIKLQNDSGWQGALRPLALRLTAARLALANWRQSS